jgi:hypothetical protein
MLVFEAESRRTSNKCAVHAPGPLSDPFSGNVLGADRVFDSSMQRLLLRCRGRRKMSGALMGGDLTVDRMHICALDPGGAVYVMECGEQCRVVLSMWIFLLVLLKCLRKIVVEQPCDEIAHPPRPVVE